MLVLVWQAYEAVLADIEAYYPKLMAGGMLAGHDYGPSRHFGVDRAVRKFAAARNLTYTVTDPPLGRYFEPICCSGWYLFKPLSERPNPAAAAREGDCFAWWLNAAVPCSALATTSATSNLLAIGSAL